MNNETWLFDRVPPGFLQFDLVEAGPDDGLIEFRGLSEAGSAVLDSYMRYLEPDEQRQWKLMILDTTISFVEAVLKWPQHAREATSGHVLLTGQPERTQQVLDSLTRIRQQLLDPDYTGAMKFQAPTYGIQNDVIWIVSPGKAFYEWADLSPEEDKAMLRVD